MLEVADRPSAGSILVGGAVLLIDKEGQKTSSQNDDMYDEDEDNPWQLSPKSALRIIRHTQGKTSSPSSGMLCIPFPLVHPHRSSHPHSLSSYFSFLILFICSSLSPASCTTSFSSFDNQGEPGTGTGQDVSTFFPSSKKGYFIKCFTDELVGFAHATKLPVVAATGIASESTL